MRIAYIVSAYHRPEQLIRLILRLNTPTTSFFIHVDKKADEWICSLVVKSLSHLTNIHFLPRHICNWGDFGHVRVTLKGITEIIRKNLPFDFVVLLTGQDYPIKRNDYIEKFLQQHKGKSFIDHFPLPHDEWEPNGGLDRIEGWHFWIGGRKYSFPQTHDPDFRASMVGQANWNSLFPRRKFPASYRPFGGSSYWCLSWESIEYIYYFTQEQSAFVKFFHYVDLPDEIFFQTILLNSPLRENLVNDDLRYIDWKDPNSGSPAVLDKSDFDRIVSSPKLFARKFDSHVDSDVLNMIDEKILGDQALLASAHSMR